MFDPYHQWLDIPSGRRPPTYYQLLGIAADEMEPEVRAFQTGPQAEACTRLLNEIAQARATLLNPSARTAYDAQLAAAAPAAIEAATALPSPAPSWPGPTRLPSRRARTRRPQSRLAALTYVLLLLLGAAASFGLTWQALPAGGDARGIGQARAARENQESGTACGEKGAMKRPASALTLPDLIEVIRGSGLLSEAAVRAIEVQWQPRSDGPADLAGCARWLAAQGYLTEYQLALLMHGHAAALVLGRYRLLDRIGRGSLAVVYKALGPQGQTVALKVLSPSKAKDPQLLARFRHEAELACELHHPNVVRAFEADEAGGMHFLALEYLPGENLREALERRGSLPVADVVHLARQTLDGLQYLFEQGLVHRNLEPSNLMLTVPPADAAPAQRGTTVKILDTSLSRSLFEESMPAGASQSRLTHERQLLGNPEYLAPEQARNARTCDIRADLYSVGCIYYHALAGRRRSRARVRWPWWSATPWKRHAPCATSVPTSRRRSNAGSPACWPRTPMRGSRPRPRRPRRCTRSRRQR